MPVDCTFRDKKVIYQRDQYQKGGFGRKYWDYRDKVIFKNIPENAKTIIDAGCGEGITLEKLRRLYPGRDIKGIDIIKENIEICQKFNLPVIEADICDLKLRAESIDCCILSEVIEHLTDYEKALSEIYRVLKKGGRLIIVFPNDTMFKLARLAMFQFKEASYDPGHVKQWTPGDMKRYLISLGYRVVKIDSIPFLFWPVSLHCVVSADKV